MNRILLITFFICPLILSGQLTVGTNGTIGLRVPSATNSQLYIDKLPGIGFNLNIKSTFNTTGATNSSFNNDVYATGNNVQVHGIWNKVKNESTNFLYGIRNDISPNGRGSKVAFRNTISDDHSSALNSAKWMEGLSSVMTHRYYPIAWGNHISITSKNDSSSDLLFGQDILIAGNAYARTVGLRVTVPDNLDPGIDNYAAQFYGKVQMTSAAIIMSDMNLKTNIAELSDALAVIDRLTPRTYRYREGTRFGFDVNAMQYGFLAQEVEEVIPSMVKNVYHSAVYQPGYFRGVPNEGEEEAPREDQVLYPAETYKAVRYNDFIPILVQAVKEQQVQIQDLKNQIQDLSRNGAAGAQSGYAGNMAAELSSLRAEIEALKRCTDCQVGSADKGFGLEEEIQIYPNPAKNLVNVEFKRASSFEVRVMQVDGKLVGTYQSEGTYLAVDTGRWVAGTYLFEILVDGEVVNNRKVIISR